MAAKAGTGSGDKVVPIKQPKAAAKDRTIQHGDNGPTQDDVRFYVQGMIALNNERDTLNSKISSYRKKAKAAGIELGELDRLIRMLEWTPEEVKESFRTRDFYAESLGLPVGSQLELFGGEETPDITKTELRWFNQGRTDGLAGRGNPGEAPSGCPPEFFPKYAEGWHKGQKETQEGFLRRQGIKPRPDEDF